jgi:hypothetical protein
VAEAHAEPPRARARRLSLAPRKRRVTPRVPLAPGASRR